MNPEVFWCYFPKRYLNSESSYSNFLLVLLHGFVGGISGAAPRPDRCSEELA
jgi:hypothetical protein